MPEEGNYRVTVTLGDPAAASVTTIKAELRRLMLERVRVGAGKIETRSFLVNVRTTDDQHSAVSLARLCRPITVGYNLQKRNHL